DADHGEQQRGELREHEPQPVEHHAEGDPPPERPLPRTRALPGKRLPDRVGEQPDVDDAPNGERLLRGREVAVFGAQLAVLQVLHGGAAEEPGADERGDDHEGGRRDDGDLAHDVGCAGGLLDHGSTVGRGPEMLMGLEKAGSGEPPLSGEQCHTFGILAVCRRPSRSPPSCATASRRRPPPSASLWASISSAWPSSTIVAVASRRWASPSAALPPNCSRATAPK